MPPAALTAAATGVLMRPRTLGAMKRAAQTRKSSAHQLGLPARNTSHARSPGIQVKTSARRANQHFHNHGEIRQRMSMKIIITCLHRRFIGQQPATRPQPKATSACVPHVEAHPGAPRGTNDSPDGCFDAATHSRSHETGGANTQVCPPAGAPISRTQQGSSPPPGHSASDQIGRMPKLAIPREWSEPQPKLVHHHTSGASTSTHETRAPQSKDPKYISHSLRTS